MHPRYHDRRTITKPLFFLGNRLGVFGKGEIYIGKITGQDVEISYPLASSSAYIDRLRIPNLLGPLVSAPKHCAYSVPRQSISINSSHVRRGYSYVRY